MCCALDRFSLRCVIDRPVLMFGAVAESRSRLDFDRDRAGCWERHSLVEGEGLLLSSSYDQRFILLSSVVSVWTNSRSKYRDARYEVGAASANHLDACCHKNRSASLVCGARLSHRGADQEVNHRSCNRDVIYRWRWVCQTMVVC